MNTRPAVSILVLMLLLALSSFAVTLSIDTTVKYQTIEGLGGFAEDAASYRPAYTQFLHDDLGVSVVRLFIEYDIERTNDNTDPNVTDLTKFALPQRAITQINALKQYGDIKFIGSLWSPAAWMKTNNDVSNGGNLRDDMRQELAEMLAAWVTLVKQNTGVDVYAISLQNESAFSEPYASCVYSSQQYLEAFKAVGTYFAAKGLRTRFYGAEHMAWAFTGAGTYEKTIKADATAAPFLYAMAVHGYTNGVQADVGSFAGVSAGNNQLWMTETSGYGLDWTGAMQLATNIHQSLGIARMSAWVWWAMEAKNDGERLLTSSLQHTKRSLVSKNYYKWVRPGAVMVKSTSGSTDLLASTYMQRANRTLSIVLVNNGTAATSVTLSGAALPASLDKFVTSASKNCASEGSVSSGGAIPIDASSVTTLFASNFGPAVSVRGATAVRQHPAASATPEMMYGLDGRITLAGRHSACVRILPVSNGRLAPVASFGK